MSALPSRADVRKGTGRYRDLLRSYAWHAPRYDRRWRRYNDATLHATIEVVSWYAVHRLLDVGCGTGLLETAARPLNRNIWLVGADLSLQMLQQAASKFERSERLSWTNALAEALPFADGSFDCIVCANCFHYFRRPSHSLEEFRRVLAAGGQLVLTDWCDDFLACKICDFLLRAGDGTHFRMYGLRGCEALLREAGFQIEIARRFKINWLWGLMTLRARA